MAGTLPDGEAARSVLSAQLGSGLMQLDRDLTGAALSLMVRTLAATGARV